MTVPTTITKISGTIVLEFDGTSLKCEAPGKNGSRRKIEVPFSALPIEIREELIAQVETSRDRQRADLMEIQRNNIQYVASQRGMGIDFAKKHWPKEAIASRVLRSRLAKAGQFDPDLGKIKETDVKKTKEVLDLGDLDL